MIKKNSTIDFIRIIACALIVYNHTSYIVSEKLNPILWANIGVQIFFFMSGYLYSHRKITEPRSWFKKNYLKIMKPCWCYFFVIFPVLALIDSSRINALKAVMYTTGFNSFLGNQEIEGLGQLWYISYILLCYIITPSILRFIETIKNRGGYWRYLVFGMFIGQLVTIPFAYLIHFKAAYIFTYIFGLFYGNRFENESATKEKRMIDAVAITFALIGLMLRIYLNCYPLPIEAVNDLLVQWVKLFQGAAIFIVMLNLIPTNIWIGKEKILSYLSSFTYEVYIVHQLYAEKAFIEELSRLNCTSIILIVLIFIALSAVALRIFENIVDNIVERVRRTKNVHSY